MKHDGARANDRGGFKKHRVEVLNFGYQDMELLLSCLTRDRLLQIVSGEIFRAYISVSIQGDVIASGKLLDFFKRSELSRFGSDRGRLSAGPLFDVVRAESLILGGAGKDYEQRLLFLIHLPARPRPDSMGGRIPLGNRAGKRDDCG